MSTGPDQLDPYGWTPRWRALFELLDDPESIPGRVVRQDRGVVLVATALGVLPAETRGGRTGPVLVGDWVVLDADHKTVIGVLDRSGLLSREDPRGNRPQPLVANVDVVLIVCGADRPRKPGRLERTAAQAWEAGATPVVLLTKVDLFEDVATEVATIEAVVPGVEVIPISVVRGDDAGAIIDVIGKRTAVLIGESGAGKSTLLNYLLGSDAAAVGSVRDSDGKGRHTTTRRELHLLENGGSVIDTPGLRSMGLWAPPEAVDAAFEDVAELASSCRFADCAHGGEPGCAVALAVERGEISRERVESWLELSKEAAAWELRQDAHRRHQEERKFGRLVDEALRMKGKR